MTRVDPRPQPAAPFSIHLLHRLLPCSRKHEKPPLNGPRCRGWRHTWRSISPAATHCQSPRRRVMMPFQPPAPSRLFPITRDRRRCVGNDPPTSSRRRVPKDTSSRSGGGCPPKADGLPDSDPNSQTQALIKSLRLVERPEELAIGVGSLERPQIAAEAAWSNRSKL